MFQYDPFFNVLNHIKEILIVYPEPELIKASLVTMLNGLWYFARETFLLYKNNTEFLIWSSELTNSFYIDSYTTGIVLKENVWLDRPYHSFWNTGWHIEWQTARYKRWTPDYHTGNNWKYFSSWKESSWNTRQMIYYAYPYSVYIESIKPFQNLDKSYTVGWYFHYPRFERDIYEILYVDKNIASHNDLTLGQVVTTTFWWDHNVIRNKHHNDGLFISFHESSNAFFETIPPFLWFYTNQMLLPEWLRYFFVTNDDLISIIGIGIDDIWTKGFINQQWFYTLEHLEIELWNNEEYKNTGVFPESFLEIMFIKTESIDAAAREAFHKEKIADQDFFNKVFNK